MFTVLKEYKYELVIFATLAAVLIIWDSVSDTPHGWGERLIVLFVTAVAIAGGSMYYRTSK